MAKRCNVCKKAYPDNERSCPYCAEAVDIIEDEGEIVKPLKKGSKNDPAMGKKRAPMEDIEVVEEVVEVEEVVPEKKGKVPPKKPAKSAPTMLAGNDIDILAEEVVEAPEKAPKEKPAPPKAGKPADAKKTQMAARSAQPTKLATRAPAPTMLAPADDADIVDAVVDEAPSSPKAPKGGPPKRERRPGTDVVDVGTLPDATGGSGSQHPFDARKESAIGEFDAVGGEILVEGASEINLGELPGGKGDRPSGLDLIAEAVESGVELRKGTGKPGHAGKKPVSEKEAADLLNDESSAVDLGSSADVSLNPFESEEMLASHSGKARASDKAKGAHGKAGTVEDAVDFGNVPDVSEPVADAEEAEAAEGVSAAALVRGGGGTATMKAPPKPRYGRRWSGGILLGLVLGIVGLGALAYVTGVIAIPGLHGGPGNKDSDKAVDPSVVNKGKLLADAQNAEKAAKEENEKLKTELKAEKEGKNKTDSELQKQLKQVKNEAMTSGAALKEANKLVEGLQASLKGAGYDAATAKDVPDQLTKVIKDKAADDAILKEASTTLKVEKDKLSAAVKKLDTDKTAADGKLARAKNRLEAAFTDKARLKDKELDQGIDLLTTDKKAVEMDRARLDGIVKTVREKLKEGKYLTGDPAKDEVVLAGLDKALKQAISPIVTALAEVTGSLAGATRGVPAVLARIYDMTRPVEREALLGYYRVREPLVQTPKKMLDTWIPLLENADRTDAAALAKKATFDANWVKKQDVLATPADKAKADYILGLALRNQLNYAEAKKLLEQAAAGPEMPNDPAWKRNARHVLWQMTDPLAYSLRYEHLKVQERWDRMLRELDAGVKAAAPARKGELLAQSSLVRLDRARATVKNKKLDAKMSDVRQAEADAKAAVAAGAVEQGNYALGRRAELLGDLGTALKHYKIAAQYNGRKDLASLYRLALARVLLQVTPAGAEDNKARKNEKAGSDKSPDAARLSKAALLKKVLPVKEEGSLTPAAMLVILNMVFLAVDDDDDADVPKNIANIEAALKLAQEAIDLGDPRGYLIMGNALTQKGLWTKGLNEYITGLEKLYPGPASRGLRQIFDEHPIFKIPDSARPPQPLVAEKHYAAGLGYFWDKKYTQAEEEFKEAVTFFDKDARYYYYLGLAQLLQKPARAGAANESFRLAKRLEDQGNPDPEEVNASLERVQGKPRKILGRLRQKP